MIYLDNLRRSLSQQREIKAKLYQQLHSLVSENPSICLSVFEVLQPQVMRYLENEKSTCPFKLEPLFESIATKVELSESLPSLLLTSLHCIRIHVENCSKSCC
jgi:hypothetical protein